MFPNTHCYILSTYGSPQPIAAPSAFLVNKSVNEWRTGLRWFYFERYLYHLSLSAWAAVTKYHWLGSLSSRHLFLTVPKARSPRSRSWLILFLIGASFLACRQPLSHCVLTRPFLSAYALRKWAPVSAYKDTNPTVEPYLHTSSKPPSENPASPYHHIRV